MMFQNLQVSVSINFNISFIFFITLSESQEYVQKIL